MYKWEGLNNYNVCYIEKFFHCDNIEIMDNLSSIISNTSFLKRFLLWKNIKFLKINNDYVGFIWFNKIEKNKYRINSMRLVSKYDSISNYEILLSIIKMDSSITCFCKDSDFEYNILQELGFKKKDTIMEMKKSLDNHPPLQSIQDVSFYRFTRNKDEKLRCNIQNLVFGDLCRPPISEEDILYEQRQSYYIEEGCIFIKFRNKTVGYGQIILDKNKIYIVNFGILKDFRRQGLGESLLGYLLDIAKTLYYNEVYLKCNLDNNKALNLYLSNGFTKTDLIHEMYKKN